MGEGMQVEALAEVQRNMPEGPKARENMKSKHLDNSGERCKSVQA